jgi:hypothetical protein
LGLFAFSRKNNGVQHGNTLNPSANEHTFFTPLAYLEG